MPVHRTSHVVEMGHLLPAESTQRWPHLKDLGEEIAALYRCGVGPLLDSTCPQALTPRERAGASWMTTASPCETAVCHRALVQELPEVGLTPRDALSVLQRDFAEVEQEGKMLSPKDLCFFSS